MEWQYMYPNSLNCKPVAVLAFKAVATMELIRRDNNQKVIALKLQMQEMMAILLQ
jgi:hypothetical protein